jgi:hypothetical protein
VQWLLYVPLVLTLKISAFCPWVPAEGKPDTCSPPQILGEKDQNRRKEEKNTTNINNKN